MRVVVVATLCCLLWPLLALAARKPAAVPVPLAQPEEALWPLPTPLPIERFTVANGLRVVVQTDRRAPVVAVGVMVDVGSRDEVPGATGVAHFFEHMMFQGSARVAKMEHVRALEGVGAEVNANTSVDRTYYYEVVPKSALALALWLEAQRWNDLALTPENVENQRQAVLAERRESYDNRPLAAAQLELSRLVFGIPALQHPTIGEAADIARTPLAAFESFWRQWYVPANAVLVLVGDVDLAEAEQLVRDSLGKLPGRPVPQRASFVQPSVREHVWRAVSDPFVQTAAFHLAWRVPAEPQSDAYALDLLGEILTGGDAGRLSKRLLRERPLAVNVGCGSEGRRDSDVFDCTVELADATAANMADAKARVRREIYDLAVRGPAPGELRRAKVAYETAYAFGTLSASRRAELLANHELRNGDARLLNGVLARYREVKPDDIRKAARTWLGWEHEVELDVWPVSAPLPKTPPGKPPEVRVLEQAAIGADRGGPS
jgi:predicted Zn-dependent peptidase